MAFEVCETLKQFSSESVLTQRLLVNVHPWLRGTEQAIAAEVDVTELSLHSAARTV